MTKWERNCVLGALGKNLPSGKKGVIWEMGKREVRTKEGHEPDRLIWAVVGKGYADKSSRR
jgi:hypothetical protein